MRRSTKIASPSEFLRKIVLPVFDKLKKTARAKGIRLEIRESARAAGLEIWSDDSKRAEIVVVPESDEKGVHAHLIWKDHRKGVLEPLSEFPFPPWPGLPAKLTRDSLFDFIWIRFLGGGDGRPQLS